MLWARGMRVKKFQRRGTIFVMCGRKAPAANQAGRDNSLNNGPCKRKEKGNKDARQNENDHLGLGIERKVFAEQKRKDGDLLDHGLPSEDEKKGQSGENTGFGRSMPKGLP